MKSAHQMIQEFKLLTNKLDTSQRRRFEREEILLFLNLGQDRIIREVAYRSGPGGNDPDATSRYPVTQAMLQPLIGDPEEISPTTPNGYPKPDDYLLFQSATVELVKSKDCKVNARVFPIDYEDITIDDPFAEDSFNWREVNMLETAEHLKVGTSPDYTLSLMTLYYIKEPPFIRDDTVTFPDGISYVGRQDCILPDAATEIIVQIASQLALSSLKN